MDMDVPYLHTGRTNQKARTRDALIAAARQLLARGVTPTVEAAATEASVGRTTAYRYFPNSRTLLAATFPEIEMTPPCLERMRQRTRWHGSRAWPRP